MTPKHYLAHLAKAYAFYRSEDEKKDLAGKRDQKTALLDRLEYMEKQARSIMAATGTEKARRLVLRIAAVKERAGRI